MWLTLLSCPATDAQPCEIIENIIFVQRRIQSRLDPRKRDSICGVDPLFPTIFPKSLGRHQPLGTLLSQTQPTHLQASQAI